ncbi:MFS transporter [Bordetella genomosp. 7]|uniref:MFS transporter n=1 Tax=Bordetella TaxID=517 RepID=UPI00047C69BC|nr:MULTISPECIES: MFS transporter [Bordetella]OZI16955.1 MFS transporter [Bordetella genomosp. 7]
MTACMQAGEHRPGHKAIPWRTVAIVGFIVCMYGAGMAAVLPVLPFYVREMGGSALILGVVFAIEALSQFVFAPLIGQLSDRYGRKRVLLATQVVAAASLLLLAAAPGLLCVLLARALFGTAAGNLSAAAAYVAERSHPDHRRQAIGILTGSVGLGGIVGAGLSGLLSDVSLTAPIYAALLLTLLALCAATYGLDDGHAAPAEPGQAHRAGGSIASVLRAPAIRILLAVMMCHFFAFGMYTSQVPVFLADTFVWNGHAFGPKQLSYLMMADGAVNVLVQFSLLGWLGARFSDRSLIVLIFTLLGTGFVVLGLAGTIPVLVFAVLCVSIGDAIAKPTYLAALSVRTPLPRQGAMLGAAQALIAVADVASPVVGGLLLSHALHGAWIGLAVGVAVAGAAAAFAGLPAARAARQDMRA